LLNSLLISTSKQAVSKPLYHNISMWQKLLSVFVLTGVEQRGEVRGSRTWGRRWCVVLCRL